MLEEAYSRWLRPNEIHALLCNHRFFTINIKPVNLPKSGTIVLFDSKMLRNFRKDGHSWKKKKDGKTIKEAHEHLKVGNEERIHVYYAHGDDNPTFVRRCYWLLDKSQEHIVLVHYRKTHEVQAAPETPGNSYSSSISDHLSAKPVADDINSGVRNDCNTATFWLLEIMKLGFMRSTHLIGMSFWYQQILVTSLLQQKKICYTSQNSSKLRLVALQSKEVTLQATTQK